MKQDVHSKKRRITSRKKSEAQLIKPKRLDLGSLGSIDKQLIALHPLCEKYDLSVEGVAQRAKNMTLPPGADGLAAVPSLKTLGMRVRARMDAELQTMLDDETVSQIVVTEIYGWLKKERAGYLTLSDAMKNLARYELSVLGKTAWNSIYERQPEDIVLMPVQLGGRYADQAFDTASHSFAANEFPLGSYEPTIIMAANPGILSRPGLHINCAGQICKPLIENMLLAPLYMHTHNGLYLTRVALGRMNVHHGWATAWIPE